MQYAIVLYLDRETEDRIAYMMRRLAESGANTYMLDNKIPPHITLAMFEKENEDGLTETVECFARDIHCFDVYFESIGVFNPAVIFLSPVVTEYLTGIHRTVHGCLSKIIADMDGNYTPDHWVPHASLGVKMTGAELLGAFEAVQREFAAFTGTVTHIALAACDPFFELYRFDLCPDR